MSKVIIFVVHILFVLFCSSAVICKKEIPSFIHVCKRGDPEFTKCLIASAEDLRPYLVTGVPEHNIPRLEPLIMTDFFTEETSGMKLTVSHVSAAGCSEFTVKSFNTTMEPDKHYVEILIEIPLLRIEAEYTINGKLLMVPLNGNGDLKANITDISARTELYGDLSQKDGDQYLMFNEIRLKVQTGGGNVRIDKIFNSDAVLLNMINDVINKNLDMFIGQLMPLIEKALESVIMETANGVVGSYPYDDLFPV